MKKSKLKNIIRNILKEQVSKKTPNKPKDVNSVIKHWESLGLTHEDMAKHIKTNFPKEVFDTNGCTANPPMMEQRANIASKDDDKDIDGGRGEERIWFILWVGLCVGAIHLLNRYEVGQWDPGENDCWFDPHMC